MLLSIVAALMFFGRGRPFPTPSAVVIDGNPVLAVMFDGSGQGISVLRVPSDTVVSAVQGYGMYPLSSVSHLDSRERIRNELFEQTVADAFGVPVAGSVYPGGVLPQDAIPTLRTVFSWGSIPRVLLGQYAGTHIPLRIWIGYVRSVQSVKPEDVEVVDAGMLRSEILRADGSVVSVLDENKLDYMTSRLFADSGIRSENFAVSVYNTTDVPSVGLRAARIMTRVGIRVVAVGNDESKTDARCEVTGSRDMLGTRTARFLSGYFRCQSVPSTEINREADIIVKLGSEYAALFQK